MILTPPGVVRLTLWRLSRIRISGISLVPFTLWSSLSFSSSAVFLPRPRPCPDDVIHHGLVHFPPGSICGHRSFWKADFNCIGGANLAVRFCMYVHELRPLEAGFFNAYLEKKATDQVKESPAFSYSAL
jgi:hypothetical protein